MLLGFNTSVISQELNLLCGISETCMQQKAQRINGLVEDWLVMEIPQSYTISLSGVPDYFYRNKISSGRDLSHYSSASLY